ncbi:hypothetical protein Tco_1021615 [Tanacetum coccineum]
MAPRYEFSLCETKQVNIGWVETFCVTLFVLKAKLNTFFGAFDLNAVLAPRIAHGALQERGIVNCVVTDGTEAWYASFGCAGMFLSVCGLMVRQLGVFGCVFYKREYVILNNKK